MDEGLHLCVEGTRSDQDLDTLPPDTKRAIGMPLAYSIGNISAVVSSQLYPSGQGPRYIQGNAVSAGLTVVPAIPYDFCALLLGRRNDMRRSPS